MTDATEVTRRKFPRDPHDFYAEDPRASRALFKAERFIGKILDPAAGRGTIVDEAKAAGFRTIASDIVDRGWGYRTHDFVDPSSRLGLPPCSNVVTNPPFAFCLHKRPSDRRDLPPFSFIRAALQFSALKVAMFLPSDYLTGVHRARFLATTPLYRVYFISPRPVIVPGVEIAADRAVDWERGSGMTDFAWFVWKHGHEGPATVHFLEIGETR